MLLSYISAVYFFAVFIGSVCIAFFKLNFTSSIGGVSEFSSVFSIILGIIPKNIVSPFVDGNTLQIIFLAFVFGIAMLFLGQKTNTVAQMIEQINYIVQFLIEFISKLVPYFIFIVLLKMIWSDSISYLQNVGKLFVVFVGAVTVMLVCMVLYTSAKNKVSPFLLFKKGLPTLLVALTTASSAATFGVNMNACRKELGIDEKITSFGIPLGMVTFKPSTAISYVVVSLLFAEMYNIEVSLPWIVIMMFSVGILAIATPPIPGGAITAYTVLFSQLGIPPQAIAIALACDTVLDFICTGGDQFLLPLIILNQAEKLGMVDKNILKSKKESI